MNKWTANGCGRCDCAALMLGVSFRGRLRFAVERPCYLADLAATLRIPSSWSENSGSRSSPRTPRALKTPISNPSSPVGGPCREGIGRPAPRGAPGWSYALAIIAGRSRPAASGPHGAGRCPCSRCLLQSGPSPLATSPRTFRTGPTLWSRPTVGLHYVPRAAVIPTARDGLRSIFPSTVAEIRPAVSPGRL